MIKYKIMLLRIRVIRFYVKIRSLGKVLAVHRDSRLAGMSVIYKSVGFYIC